MTDSANKNPEPPSEAGVAALRSAIDVLRAASPELLQQLGWHFQANDFYSPLNDIAFLKSNRDLWETEQDPREIDWSIDRQMRVAEEVGQFVDELRDVPQEASTIDEYCWNNHFWNNADALVQYGLVRSRKPGHVVEIGCGWSSLLLAKALARNAAEAGADATRVTQVEPYPRRELLATLPGHWRLHECPLQRAPLELFESLGAGDVLFYDGSHCAKVASDVNWFFFEVLPRLPSGVLIHIHDIFLPNDYPEEWTIERAQSWNEQYVLRAFLMHNNDYRIEIANRYLWVHRGQELTRIYKGVQPNWGVSFWMVKR